MPESNWFYLESFRELFPQFRTELGADTLIFNESDHEVSKQHKNNLMQEIKESFSRNKRFPFPAPCLVYPFDFFQPHPDDVSFNS